MSLLRAGVRRPAALSEAAMLLVSTHHKNTRDVRHGHMMTVSMATTGTIVMVAVTQNMTESETPAVYLMTIAIVGKRKDRRERRERSIDTVAKTALLSMQRTPTDRHCIS